MTQRIEVEKHWFRLSPTTWQLLIEVAGHVLTKAVIIYDTRGDYAELLALNKKLKENDLVEQAWSRHGLRIALVDHEA